MPDLAALRQRIDEIDSKISSLFEQRMETAGAVADFKRRAGLSVLDSSREEEVVAEGRLRIQNPALLPYYEDFLRHTMALSRAWQTACLGENRVACQGAPGGFGYQAAQKLFPHGEMLALPTFADVFDAVSQGRAAAGVVPFENSITGDVYGILDLCYAHPHVFVTQMYDLPVTQCLLGLPGAKLSSITTVISHAQALQQSQRFINNLNLTQQTAPNTALAAKQVSEAGNAEVAAIASLEAGELYGLVPLALDIATEANNTTRFLALGRTLGEKGDKLALLASVENKVGSLGQIIQTISEAGLNMESIKSRPMPNRPWEYYFYIEMTGSFSGPVIEGLLESLRPVCLSVHPLGVFFRS